jgi:hypothetical protein
MAGGTQRALPPPGPPAIAGAAILRPPGARPLPARLRLPLLPAYSSAGNEDAAALAHAVDGRAVPDGARDRRS